MERADNIALLLLIATQEPLDPANPDQMTRSRAIAELMIDCAGDTD